MARLVLENWLIRARWHTTRLSNIGKIGIGLCVLALVFFFTAIVPQKQALKELKNKVKAMQQVQTGAAGQVKLDNNQALQVFYDFFPRSDSSPYWINELDRIAKSRSVELNSSDYRLTLEKGSKLVRYEIQLPVRGSYPQIRAFIADALQAIPALALVDVMIKRETIQSGRLEARLSMHLYLNDY